MNISTGTLIGDRRYSVERLLGEGGYGEVYLARDSRMERFVVLKIPRPSLLAERGFAERFRREIRALVELSHPNITRVLDQGEHEGVPFCVLEFMSGGTLEDRLRSNIQRTQQSPETLFAWLPRIAEALDFIHSKGFIHRDVKPANVLFDEHGHAYLSDFGIAKLVAESENTKREKSLTGTGFAMGAVDYMAPELFESGPIDGQVDQYALAIAVFETLAGLCPFEAPTPIATLLKHKTEPPPLINSIVSTLSSEFSSALQKALSKEPSQRYSSCHEFANQLLQHVEKNSNPPGRFQIESGLRFKSRCPECNKKLAVPYRKIGETVKCPKCKLPFEVPSPAENQSISDTSQRLQQFSNTWPIETSILDDPNLQYVSTHNESRHAQLEVPSQTPNSSEKPPVGELTSSFVRLTKATWTTFLGLKRWQQLTLIVVFALLIFSKPITRYLSVIQRQSNAKKLDTFLDSVSNDTSKVARLQGYVLASRIPLDSDFSSDKDKYTAVMSPNTSSKYILIHNRKKLVLLDYSNATVKSRIVANSFISHANFSLSGEYLYFIDSTNDPTNAPSKTALHIYSVVTGEHVANVQSQNGTIVAVSQASSFGDVYVVAVSGNRDSDAVCERIILKTGAISKVGSVSSEITTSGSYRELIRTFKVGNYAFMSTSNRVFVIDLRTGASIYDGFWPISPPIDFSPLDSQSGDEAKIKVLTSESTYTCDIVDPLKKPGAFPVNWSNHSMLYDKATAIQFSQSGDWVVIRAIEGIELVNLGKTTSSVPLRINGRSDSFKGALGATMGQGRDFTILTNKFVCEVWQPN